MFCWRECWDLAFREFTNWVFCITYNAHMAVFLDDLNPARELRQECFLSCVVIFHLNNQSYVSTFKLKLNHVH
jgi:hypothetical protein